MTIHFSGTVVMIQDDWSSAHLAFGRTSRSRQEAFRDAALAPCRHLEFGARAK